MSREEDNGFSDWGGYFEAKKAKLEEQFAAASDPFRKTNLFNGISIFVNGLVNPSADELKRIMMVHGGTFHHYERPHTNFIIASNLPDVKVRKMDTSRIISAQWVVDCVQQMRILDYKPYLLYTNHKTTQPRLNFGKGKNNDSMIMEGKQENDLGGSLKDLHQVVATSPDKGSSTAINLSTVTTSSNNVARTAVDPAFLSEFYKNSRLHHIATLGSGFKQYVCELRQLHGNRSFPKRAELRTQLCHERVKSLPSTEKRYVMHIDMDCFFVSVGLRNHPELRGLPVAVTHSKGGNAATDVPVHPQANRQVEQELFAQRFEHLQHDNNRLDKVRNGFEKKMSLSEIASCSYEAREKGIKNGMFVGQALKLCPDLKTIPYDFEGYRQVAFALYDTVAQYTLNIEAVSCDEMFVDLTDLLQELNVDVMVFVTHLRQEVRDKTSCPCSAGVGGNKLLARMATKLAKPNGQHLLDTDDAANYMSSFPLDVLPGVGSSMAYKLNQAGLKTCADVQLVSLSRLEMLLGKKMALTLRQNCRGIDPRPLVYEQQRKSVSAEVNYGIRFTKTEDLEKFLQQLCIEVHSRLIEIKRKTKSITLKLMVRAAEAPVETSKYMGHGVCDNQTKSSLLKQSTDDVHVIITHVLKLMKESGIPPHELRGIGIHLSKLDDATDSKKTNVIKNMFTKISEKQKGKVRTASVSIAEPVCTITKPDLLMEENNGKEKSFDSELIPKDFSTAYTDLGSIKKSESVKTAGKKAADERTSRKKSFEAQSLETKSYEKTSYNKNSNNTKSFETKSHKKKSTEKNKTEMETEKKSSQKIAMPGEVNVLAMLKNAATTKKATSFKIDPIYESFNSNEKDIPLIKQLDADVLAQLPMDIRSEILKNPEQYLSMSGFGTPTTKKKDRSNPCGMRSRKENEQRGREIKIDKKKRKTATKTLSMSTPLPTIRIIQPINTLTKCDLDPSTSKAAQAKLQTGACRHDKIVAKYVQELPKHMHPAIIKYLIETKTIPEIPPELMDDEIPKKKSPRPVEQENVFVDPNYKDILATWVKSEEFPLPADVDLMHDNISQLIENNEIDKVYEVMKHLCSLIKSNRAANCRWHKAYNSIESSIQEKAQDVLDCHIYFTELIGCNKCAS